MRKGIYSHQAKFSTIIGDFIIGFDVNAAPKTSHYFLDLVKFGALVGASIFRIVTNGNAEMRTDTPINVVQLGIKEPSSEFAQAIEHETTKLTGLIHKKWTISAAREAVGCNYASFFICMRDEPSLDFGGARHPDGQGFAAFGKVLTGYDVITKIYGLAERQEYLSSEIQLLDVQSVAAGG